VNGSSTSWGTTEDAIAPFGKFSATARPGRCATGCKLIIPFAIVTFTTSLIGAMANVAWTMVNFRSVMQIFVKFIQLKRDKKVTEF
jgi:hypothetical protein